VLAWKHMQHSTTDSAAHTFTCMLAFLGAILVSKLLQRRCRLISGSRLSLERVFCGSHRARAGNSDGSLREKAAMHQHRRDLIRRSRLSSCEACRRCTSNCSTFCMSRLGALVQLCDLSSLTCRVVDKTDKTEGPESLPGSRLCNGRANLWTG